MLQNCSITLQFLSTSSQRTGMHRLQEVKNEQGGQNTAVLQN